MCVNFLSCTSYQGMPISAMLISKLVSTSTEQFKALIKRLLMIRRSVSWWKIVHF